MQANIDLDRDEIKNNYELSDLFRSKGPVWYRGFFVPDTLPEVTDIELTNILEHFKVDKIFVGHTTIDSVQSYFEERVINVDGGIKYGERGEGLLIINEQFYKVDLNGKQELVL
jgi:hypothetical protein